MTVTHTKEPQQGTSAKVCTQCGGKILAEDRARGELTCTTCGFVLEQSIADLGPEWRAFTIEERDNRARTGSPMSLAIPDKGLSTQIGWGERDGGGRALSGEARTMFYRMRKWQFRSLSYSSKMRNLGQAMNEMERLCSQLGIPRSIRDTAAFVYRKTLEKRQVRGQKIDAIVAGSVYLSCRMHHAPRQMDEIAAEAKIDRRSLGAAIRKILQHTDIDLPLPSAKALLPRISSDLGLKGGTIQRAISIIDEAQEIGLTCGKSPAGIVGAALYIASIIEEDRRTQRDIAQAAMITEVTIRNRYKQLVNTLKIDIGTMPGFSAWGR
jgi:transcription initiation factor TFIIB